MERSKRARRRKPEMAKANLEPPLTELRRTRAEPDVWPACSPIFRQHLLDVLRSLGEEQPIEVRAVSDQVPKVGAPFRWGMIIEHV